LEGKSAGVGLAAATGEAKLDGNLDVLLLSLNNHTSRYSIQMSEDTIYW